MVDAPLNVTLLEVNSNPCLEFSCPLLEQLITRVVEDTFRCVLAIYYALVVLLMYQLVYVVINLIRLLVLLLLLLLLLVLLPLVQLPLRCCYWRCCCMMCCKLMLLLLLRSYNLKWRYYWHCVLRAFALKILKNIVHCSYRSADVMQTYDLPLL